MDMKPKKTRSKMGRPPLPPEQRRSECIMVRCTRKERKRLEAEARKANVSLAELLMLPRRKES